MTLEAKNLSLSMSGVSMLRDVSVDITPGQVHTVLGPNGAGKTSLLRALVGDWSADKGQVLLNQLPVDQWRPEERAHMLAILPQHSLLDFPFSGLEVVLLGRTPHDSGAHRDEEIARAALDKVDAAHLAERHYTQLSGGEKQRVQLARVLAQIYEPCQHGERFLILDEPTASFDLAHQQLTLDIVTDLARQGVGVFMVIHDLNLAARCADQMLLMLAGEIVCSGPPARVLQTENIARVFGVDAVISTHPISGTPLVVT